MEVVPMPFTGYRIDLERRDELANSSVPMGFTLRDFQAPAKVDPRGFLRHDKQFSMGSCAGHGLTNTGELCLAYALGLVRYLDDQQFSRLFAYLEGQRFDGLLGQDAGMTIAAGVRVAKEVGFIYETELPYTLPYPRNAGSVVTPRMRERAKQFQIKSHTWCKSYEDVYLYLSSHSGGVFQGHPWNNSMYARSSSNTVEQIQFTARDGGHATMYGGYSERKDSRGRNYLWRLNSHQEAWVEVAPSVIDQLFKHQYTVMVGLSDLSTPEPRNVDFSKESVLG